MHMIPQIYLSVIFPPPEIFFTDQNKGFPGRYNHRDGLRPPRILGKVKSDASVSNDDLPAAWDCRAEGCIYGTWERKVSK